MPATIEGAAFAELAAVVVDDTGLELSARAGDIYTARVRPELELVSGTARGERGGGWLSPTTKARTSARGFSVDPSPQIGFRCAQSMP